MIIEIKNGEKPMNLTSFVKNNIAGAMCKITHGGSDKDIDTILLLVQDISLKKRLVELSPEFASLWGTSYSSYDCIKLASAEIKE